MCRFVSIACAFTASIVVCSAAQAATMAELRRIDFNGNNALDAGPEFRAYLELEKLTGDLNAKQLARVGSLQADIAVLGSIPLTQLAEKESVQTTSCDRGQGFYLRRNKLDVSIYNASIDDSAAECAAISFTGDFEADTETAERGPGCLPGIHAARGRRAWALFSPIFPAMPLRSR